MSLCNGEFDVRGITFNRTYLIPSFGRLDNGSGNGTLPEIRIVEVDREEPQAAAASTSE